MVLFSHGWLWDLWAWVGFGKTGRKGKRRRDGLGDVAGAGAGQLVGVNEEAPVGVARVDGEHPVVDVLLGALGLVARSQQPAGTVGGQAGLQPGGLSVVVVAVAVALGDVLEDDPPVALNIHCSGDLGVVNVGGAEIALGSDPVGGVVRRGALGGTSVVLVVKGLFLFLGDVLDQVIGRLVSNVSILLQEESILRDLVSDVIGRVLRVQDTVGKVTALGTLGWGLGVTVGVGGGVVRFGGVGGWCRGIGGGGGVVDGVDGMGGMVDRGNHGGTVVEDLPDQDRYGEYKKGCNLQEEGKVTRRKLRASLALTNLETMVLAVS